MNEVITQSFPERHYVPATYIPLKKSGFNGVYSSSTLTFGASGGAFLPGAAGGSAPAAAAGPGGPRGPAMGGGRRTAELPQEGPGSPEVTAPRAGGGRGSGRRGPGEAARRLPGSGGSEPAEERAGRGAAWASGPGGRQPGPGSGFGPERAGPG